MNKKDLAIYLGIIEIANKAGLLSVEAFQEIGQSAAKLRSAIDKMGENDMLVIQKQAETTDGVPSEAGAASETTDGQ